MADKVIPDSLNYADIKSEAVESEIKFVKFTPTTNARNARGNDMIKFLLTGNGFIDPYSTSFRFTVEATDLVNDPAKTEFRWVDRSAHSFIQRMIIRSQGVEIERIENYDVIAAMIHDMIYSPEYNQLHFWEGFPPHLVPDTGNDGLTQNNPIFGWNIDAVNDPNAQFPTVGAGYPEGYLNPYAGGRTQVLGYNNMPMAVTSGARRRLCYLIYNASSTSLHRFVGEPCFFNARTVANTSLASRIDYTTSIPPPNNFAATSTANFVINNTDASPVLNLFRMLTNTMSTEYPCDTQLFRDMYFTSTNVGPSGNKSLFSEEGSVIAYLGSTNDAAGRDYRIYYILQYVNDFQTDYGNAFFPKDFAYHSNGKRVPFYSYSNDGNGRMTYMNFAGQTDMQFILPIYSGLLGVLMPDKKLLPLNLMPLDIEITFNPHALYSSAQAGSRYYEIKEFNIYSHVIFFEQEIHRSLEAAVAEHGIFIYCNSFHYAPTTLIQGKTLPSFAYISMNLKSINSIHTLFYYNIFETYPQARKLHFVSHNITSLQVLNGTTLIPYEAIEGDAGTSKGFKHLPFLLSTYQAWNKMHDPKTDGAISSYNYCTDALDGYANGIPIKFANDSASSIALEHLINKYTNVGRCYYGISLEGEELGTDKTMITGRKSQYPFLLYMKSSYFKRLNYPSYMYTFLRADYIVFIRPDLQIVTLGK